MDIGHYLLMIPTICATIAAIMPAPNHDDPNWYTTLYDVLRRIGVPSKRRDEDS